MLTTRLKTVPYSKFVLIQDSVDHRGHCLLKHIVNLHLKTQTKNVVYFNFEFNSKLDVFGSSKVKVVDFVSAASNWTDDKRPCFKTTLLESAKQECVIIIDSLAHAILYYGFISVYKLLQQLLSSNNGVLSLVALLHQDLLDNNEVSKSFEHLSTFSINIEASLSPHNVKVLSKYKKNSGKVIKEVEEYKFENNDLEVRAKELVDLMQSSINQTLPENLTTFKISLGESEKDSRAKLVLPYLPKANIQDESEESGKIYYKFDHMDDWDEEDPDDDLDL